MPAKRTVVASGGEDPPRKSTRRNTQVDRDFIAGNKYNFRMMDGQLVYTGEPLDFGYPYQLPPDEFRCTFEVLVRDDEGNAVLDVDREELKRRCPKWGMQIANGRTLHLCLEHVPRGAAGVQAAIKEMMLSASLAVTAAVIKDAKDPKTQPRDRVAIWREMMDRVGVRGGVEISADVALWERVLGEMIAEEGSDGAGRQDPGAEGS